MKIDQIPDYIEGNETVPVTVRFKKEVWQKLQLIKKVRRKKTSDILKRLVDEFLEENEAELKDIA